MCLSTLIVFHKVELHLSRVTGTASRPDVHEIWTVGFFFENRLHWQLDVRVLLFT